MNPNTAEIVAKLWKECKTLQSAGVSYSNYVNELTYLLFLKMLEETGQETRLPNDHCWSRLAGMEGGDQLEYYKKMLLELGNPKETHDPVVLAIFTDAMTHLRLPKDLKTLTTNIDKLDWFTAREDGLGDLYEGLLEKTTSATKSKAGQYFTPRALIDSIIRLVKPKPGEVVQDPAAGRRLPDCCGSLHQRSHGRALLPLRRGRAFPTSPSVHWARMGARHPPALRDEHDPTRDRKPRGLRRQLRPTRREHGQGGPDPY